MRFLVKAIFFIPGAAIGFIAASAIKHFDEATALVISALGATVGGSITTAFGTLLFLRAEKTAEQSNTATKIMLRPCKTSSVKDRSTSRNIRHTK